VRTFPTRGSVILAFGELIQDVVVQPDGDLAYNGGHVDGAIAYFRGGCGPNVAAGCAQMGVPARFLGHAGADPIGDQLIRQLREASVDVIAIRRGETASSLSISKPNGDTALVFSPGASRSVDAADIRADQLTGVAIAHVNSHHLYAAETRPAFGQLLGYVHAADVLLSVDVSAANRLIEYGAENYRKDLALMRPDVLMANAKEAEILGLLDQVPDGVGRVIVHRGGKSTIVLDADGSRQEFDVSPIDSIVDSVGGGDAFAAGYLSAILQKRPLHEAIQAAHELAAQIVRQAGVEFVVERNPEIRRQAG
jgi:sugar/nucleoside kinase (ribokinase family)